MARAVTAMLLAIVALAGCGPSTRVVTYEEEVRLGAQEVVWVRRADHFRRHGGNPLEVEWTPDHRVYEFTVRGRPYRYESRMPVSLGAIRLHLRGDEVVVIDAASGCAGGKLFAEHRWDGQQWRARPVGSDVVGQPRNLMRSYSADVPAGTRLTDEEKRTRDTSPRGPRTVMAIEAGHVGTC